jgi:DNA invertase Pin-like site-specific DNA recombinase
MEQTFTENFQTRLARLEQEASELGESWSSICRGTGISRATPDRWKREVPNTVVLLDKMEAYLAEKRKQVVALGRGSVVRSVN